MHPLSKMVSRTPSTSSCHPSPTASTSSSATPRPRSGSRSRPAPKHPLLETFWVQAKLQAGIEHDAKEALRPTRTIGKPLTKRQESNKRSAMICRAQKNIYIRLIEAEIPRNEEHRLQLYNDKLTGTAENLELRRRIRILENKLAKEEEKRSVFNIRSLLDDSQEEDHFVQPVPGLYNWGFDDTPTHSAALYQGDEESEIARSMDFLPGYHTDSEITYIEGDAMSTMAACKEGHTSPVAISETAVEVPEGDMRQPASRTV